MPVLLIVGIGLVAGDALAVAPGVSVRSSQLAIQIELLLQ